MRWLTLVGWLGLLPLACAPREDPRFVAGARDAAALSAAGRHRAAAERWLEVGRTASEPRDRDEATYRAAVGFERAADPTTAERLYLSLERGTGERAARAAFARARLVGRADETRGQGLLRAALGSHPESGLAPRALAEHLEWVERTSGGPAAVATCRRLGAELGESELDEALRYQLGLYLERAGDFAGARDAYLACAERHPYPRGAYWDDALSRAARCEEHLGHASAAIGLLERMLAEREVATNLGSYERIRYAEARFRIAELARDELHDTARARREFRRVYEVHTTSLLRDDSLWQEILLARREHDLRGACEAAELLLKTLPESRYAGCVAHVCPRLASPPGRTCPSYTRRTL